MRQVAQQNISPGARIKAELRKRKMTQKQFAETVGLVPSHVSDLISNRRTITIRVASKLQDFFDIPAKEWLDMQTNYRLTHKEDAAEMEAAEELYKYDEWISLKTLFMRSGGNSFENSAAKLYFLKKEFGIVSLHQLQSYGGFFRKSDKTGLDVRMLNTWTFLARRDSQRCVVTGKFDRSTLAQATSELFTIFHSNMSVMMRTKDVLAHYGIKFCETPKVDHASVDGFSFIEGGVPAIVVTRRFDRIDNLAFAIMHELCHVYKHLSKDGDQRINIEGYSEETQREENEANEFAVNALIPAEVWKNEAPTVKPIPHVIQREYTRWANKKGYNKWIVLGRIAHDMGHYQMRADNARKVN